MNLLERIKGILLKPKDEWQVIATEPGTPQALYPNYIVPLAAIGPLASVIGLSVLGMSVPMGGSIRIGFFSALSSAVVHYVLALASVYVIALLIDALAPTFGARKDPSQSFKVATYSMTPGWLAGIFSLLPGFLSILGFLLSLYGIYLLYLGILALMRPPQEKAIIYTAVVIVLSFLIMMAIGAISSIFIR
jgi:hypothetical protein